MKHLAIQFEHCLSSLQPPPPRGHPLTLYTHITMEEAHTVVLYYCIVLDFKLRECHIYYSRYIFSFPPPSLRRKKRKKIICIYAIDQKCPKKDKRIKTNASLASLWVMYACNMQPFLHQYSLWEIFMVSFVLSPSKVANRYKFWHTKYKSHIYWSLTNYLIPTSKLC